MASLTKAELIATLRHSIERLGGATEVIGGRVGFSVLHGDGTAWTVDLGSPGGRWTDGLDDPTVVVCGSEAALSALVLGTDVPARATRGELVVIGDAELLGKLGRVLSSGGSPLRQRLRGR